MKRLATWTLAAAFVLGATAVIWSLAYAGVTGVSFKTWALISSLTKTDPLLSFKHVAFYWSAVTVRKNAAIAAGLTVAIFGGGWLALFLTRPSTLFGGARFARGGDLFRANMHAKNGLILGWHGTTLLRNDDPRHPLVIGPTRSGKGRGFVIPNLLAWEGSTITVDVKQENFRETAAARRTAGDEVYMFAPGSARSHCYNPLDFVREGPSRITDLTNVAHFLIPDPKSGESIWSQKARDLFVGVLGYVLESSHIADKDRTIRTALRVLSTGRDVGALLKAIVKAESGELSSFVVGRFNQIVAEPADTRGSVLANLTTALAPWDNPLIAAVTQRSDFDIRELRRKRMSIYIGPPPSDLTSYRSLIRLLVQQIYDALTRKEPGPGEHHVLVMLDEFRQLQRMDAIVEQIPLSAGYGFRMAAILQNLSQLDELYGRAARESIVANCALKLFVGVDDLATANYVSDQLGQKTVTSNTTTMRGGGWLRESSISKSLTGVPLMRPDEVIRLPRTQSILMTANELPILTTKIRYDKDRWFRALTRTGKSTFRSVPELVVLREPMLAILTPGYGKSANPAQDTEDAVPDSVQSSGMPAPAPEGPQVSPESPAHAPSPQSDSAPRVLSRPMPVFGDGTVAPQLIMKEDVKLDAAEISETRIAMASELADAQGVTINEDGDPPALRSEIAADSVSMRPKGRQQETLFDMMAEAHEDLLRNVGALDTIAEMVERQTSFDPVQREAAVSVASDLRELAQSSLEITREDLKEVLALRSPDQDATAHASAAEYDATLETPVVPTKKARAPRKGAANKRAAPEKMPLPTTVKKAAGGRRALPRSSS